MLQGAKHYLKHGRSVDHYESKLSYSEYEENHNSPRVAPTPYPRPSLKQRSQPVAITAMYENVEIKQQNPRRKLKRNIQPGETYDSKMNDRERKHSNQERSSLESLLDDQSMNSPSDCERNNGGPRIDVPLSPSHYEQPPTPDHPPPSAKQAENSIHERIRPLSQVSPWSYFSNPRRHFTELWKLCHIVIPKRAHFGFGNSFWFIFCRTDWQWKCLAFNRCFFSVKYGISKCSSVNTTMI